MGEDGVGLTLGQIGAQRFGIAQGGHRMVKALVARVGGPVGGIVEVQVVEQARPGGGPLVPAKAPGQAEGSIGHEQGVLIAGDGKMVTPLLHRLDLRAFQQGSDTVQERGLLGTMHGDNTSLNRIVTRIITEFFRPVSIFRKS